MLAELIRLTTSDGLIHYGAIYPARTSKPDPLGVVIVHGLTGSFVGEIESALPPYWLGSRVSPPGRQQPRHGHCRAPPVETLAGCIPDIRAALDLMEARGFQQVVLFGHSKAGPKVTYYLTKTGDPRVAALGRSHQRASVHEMPVWFTQQFGKRDPKRLVGARAVPGCQGQGGHASSPSRDWPFLISAKTVVDHVRTQRRYDAGKPGTQPAPAAPGGLRLAGAGLVHGGGQADGEASGGGCAWTWWTAPTTFTPAGRRNWLI